MVTEKRPKRVRKRKPKPSGRKIVKAKHGDTLNVPANSEVNIHIEHGKGRRVWLEVVPVGLDDAPPGVLK